MSGSGVLSSSWVSPDSRAESLPAVRQKFHLTHCAKIRDHLWVRAAAVPLIGAFWLQELLGPYYGGVPAVLGETHWGTSCSRVTHRPRQNRFARRILTAASARSRQLARLLPAKNR